MQSLLREGSRRKRASHSSFTPVASTTGPHLACSACTKAANILDTLRRASVAALTSAELKKQFESRNATPSPTTPDEFAAFVQAEQAKWGPVVLATGVKLE